MSDKKIDHTNIFESFIAQDIFVFDILDKIATDWKKANRIEFNRENFEDFILDEFHCWLENELYTYLEDEFGEVEDE